MKFLWDASEWHELQQDSSDLALLRKNVKVGALIDDGALVSTRDLSFYEEYRLLRIRPENSGERVAGTFCLCNGADIVHLDGTSPPLHEFNQKAPIQLSDESALLYLSFFCFFVTGEDGPFFVVDNVENDLLPVFVNSPQAKVEEDAALEIRRLFRPPELFGVDDDGKFRASAMIYYSDAIFVSDFLIGSSGLIEMLDDEPLIGDLPAPFGNPLLPS